MNNFQSIYTHLISYPAPLLPPLKPLSTALTPKISSLQVHPTLEAALHILNLDLSSAHFLVRHMQSGPAYEGMYLHGILHRIEGDYDNARAWYSDVKRAEVYSGLWGREGVDWKEWKKAGGDKDQGQTFLDDVQSFKERSKSSDEAMLQGNSRRELEHVISYCIEKFGLEKWEDASEAWTKHSEDIRKIGEDQVSGDVGRRNF